VSPGLAGTISIKDSRVLLLLRGTIDQASAGSLTELLEHALSSQMPILVVDLEGVTSCDRQAVAPLVEALAQQRTRGGQLSVIHAPAAVSRLLQGMGISVELHDQRADSDAPTPTDGDLLPGLAAAVHFPMLRNVLDAALALVVTMSQSVLHGADGVSITLPREGRLRTVAASNDVVLHMDHDQYETEQGPCWDAATYGEPVHSPSLEAERRWPHFVPRARARGINSIMSSPLTSLGEPLGALNVYSRTPRAFAEHELGWASQFADEATKVLMTASAGPSLQDLNEELTAALHSRELITLAQGIVMTRRGLSAAAAQRFLVDVSRTTSRPLLGICGDVVRTAEPEARR
jgi:anti-anti-sigma factor